MCSVQGHRGGWPHLRSDLLTRRLYCSAYVPPKTLHLTRTPTPPSQVWMDRGRIEEPRTCQQCGSKMSMELIHNRSMFSDKQV